jgi:FMN phosphatase YigB (HAD superfamily)
VAAGCCLLRITEEPSVSSYVQNMHRLLLWDFDGTLGYRPGLWRGCLVETLDEHAPDHGIESDQLRPFLRDGFPWHQPDIAHPELCDPDAWWQQIERLITNAFVGVGIDEEQANKLARHARYRFIDPGHGWRLFDDTLPVLDRLAADGWRHAILSNHVPELPDLVAGLGLADVIQVVHTSALTGYEKPHPEAFRNALRANGDPDEVWMIGDNPTADVAGAEAAGIRAILVRTDSPDVPRRARDLYEAAAVIERESTRADPTRHLRPRWRPRRQ